MILLNYIRSRLMHGKSGLILVVGEQRSGKTAIALRIAYEIDHAFDIDKQMFFKIQEFAGAMHRFNRKPLILDEAGVSLDPYEHMTITQRVYNHIIQTQAYKQNVVFLCLPFASEIGKQHRKHVNAIVEVQRPGVCKVYATFKWYADLSFKPPRSMLIEHISNPPIPLPPPHIWDKYRSEFEKQYKESILNLQNDILDKKFQGKGSLSKDSDVVDLI